MNRVPRNTLFLYTSFGITFFLTIARLKLITFYLSKETVGIYFAILSFSLFFFKLPLQGFTLTLQRYIPLYEAKNSEEREFLIHIILRIYTVIGLFILGLFFLLQKQIVLFFFHKENLNSVLLKISLGVFFLSLLTLISSVFNSLRKSQFIFISDVGQNLLYVAILFIMKEYLSLNGIANIFLLSTIVPLIIILPILPGRPWKIPVKVFISTWSYFKYSLIVSIISPFFIYFDRILATLFFSFESVAHLSVAKRIFNFAGLLLYVPQETLGPEISYQFEKKNKKKYRKLLYIYILFCITLSIMGILAFIFLGDWLIPLLTRKDYIPVYPILLLFLFSLIPASLSSPIGMLIRVTGHIKTYLRGDLLWILLYLFSIFILIKPLKVISFPTVQILAQTGVLIYYLRKILKIRL